MFYVYALALQTVAMVAGSFWLMYGPATKHRRRYLVASWLIFVVFAAGCLWAASMDAHQAQLLWLGSLLSMGFMVFSIGVHRFIIEFGDI